MKMRYKKLVGIFLIILGALDACVYLLLGFGSSPIILLFLGLVAILFGVLFLQGTYFIVNDDNLVFYALIGSAKRTYKVLSLKEFEIENNNIYITINQVKIHCIAYFCKMKYYVSCILYLVLKIV